LRNSPNDEISSSLQKWALAFTILGFVAAVGFIVLFFATSCIDSSYSGCQDRYYNPFYIVGAIVAVIQGFYVSILLDAASRVINYLKWIAEDIEKKR
jgi:hypothetical protein